MELTMNLIDQDIITSEQAIVAHNKYEIFQYKVTESIISNSVGDIAVTYKVDCPVDFDLPIIYYDTISKEFRAHVQMTSCLDQEEFSNFIKDQQIGLEVLKFLNEQFCSNTGA